MSRATVEVTAGTVDLTATATELLRSTLRKLVVVVSVTYFAWHLLATTLWPIQFGDSVIFVSLLVGLTALVTWKLLGRHLIVAQIVWQSGLAAAITLAAYRVQEPAVVFFLAVLPLLSTVTLGWPAAMVSGSVSIALAWWVCQRLLIEPAPLTYVAGVAIGGIVLGLIGWSAMQTLLTVTEWSWHSHERAQKLVEEAQQQRMELKQTQEDLVQANREMARLFDRLKAMHQAAEQARQVKELFVANVSHELRTPLNMIIGFSELIAQAPRVYGNRLPPALLADITAIWRNSQHLSRLVNDVLDLSQVDAGRMVLAKELVSPEAIVTEAIEVIRYLFESKNLYLRTGVATDLPVIHCDRTRVRQVLINLLSNAGRFTDSGGVEVKVWQEPGSIIFSVADTGPGIPADQHARIFEPFEQVDTSIRRRHEGTGLGLSISRRFVELHGGKMELTSQVGQGTTVCFSLPLPAPTAASDKPWAFPGRDDVPIRERRSLAPRPDVKPRYVLLDEHETLQRLFSRHLAEVETISARDASDAAQTLARAPANALIVNAPWCGCEPPLHAQVKSLPYDTPTIFCWMPSEDEVARRLGVEQYLVKPVNRADLLGALAARGEDVHTVLLVDDEPQVLQLFGRLLASAEREYTVLLASDGRRALSLMRRRQPDVVLLDLVMPEMDGFAVLREKSQDPLIKDIPVIVVSSKDPTGEPIVTDRLTVARGVGLTASDLLSCIQAVSKVLCPAIPGHAPAPPENRND